PVIANPGRRMEHRYRLTNASGQDVKILNVINRKTCCGIVRAEAPVLLPGDTTGVVVTLLVGDRCGEVTHETAVVTVARAEPSLILGGMGRGIPTVRMEEDSTCDGTILIGTKEPRQAAYRVYASGTAAEPPARLDGMELRSTIKVEWAGSKETNASNEGLP